MIKIDLKDIIYRAKEKDTGKWVYGSYFKNVQRQICPMDDQLNEEDVKHLMLYNSFADWNMSRTIQCIQIDPKTLGIYSGFNDKNGKKIFTGDIVQLINIDDEIINFTMRFGNVKRQMYGGLTVDINGFYCEMLDQKKLFPLTENYLSKHDSEIWEVVGNIHDSEM